jgi:hypothetical protein
MRNAFAAAAAAALIAIGVYYTIKDTRHPADDPALSSIAKAAPSVKSICVEPVRNLSKKPVAMDNVDDELVAQLHSAGFESRKISAGGAACDAVTNAEIVDITGRGRKTARVDYRLTITGEQVPRLSSTAEGKSGGDSLDKTLDQFTINPGSKQEDGAAHHAIVAAFAKTAAQIDAANKRGLPPWQARQE